MCYQSAIIHISDTEFGLKNRAEQKEIKEQYQQPYSAIMDSFISDVKKVVVDEHGVNPSKIGLVISGDIANEGKHEEFQKAEENIASILEQLKIPHEQLAIVPGNHDVNWNDCEKAYYVECRKTHSNKEKVKEQTCRSPQKLAEFSQFFRRMCKKDFKIQTPTNFEGFEKLGFILIGLDTTYPCLWSEEDNYGAVPYEQIKAARRYLEKWRKKKDNLVSIAAMHHSLLPDIEEKNSYLHHAEHVKMGLEENQGFDIVLCGHKHTSKRSRSISGDFIILVTGSFGLCFEELMSSYREGKKPITNKYQVVLLAPDRRLKFLYRRLNRENASPPAGVWEEDKSEGQAFDKVRLRDPKTAVEDQSAVGINIDVARPVISSTPKGDKHWVIGVRISDVGMSAQQVKAVKYKIEPGGEEFHGDPNCDFLASLSVNELQGRSVSAYITLDNDKEISKENIGIPVSCYDPFHYDLLRWSS